MATPETEEKEPNVTYRALCMFCGTYVREGRCTARLAPENGEMRDALCPACEEKLEEKVQDLAKSGTKE